MANLEPFETPVILFIIVEKIYYVTVLYANLRASFTQKYHYSERKSDWNIVIY